MAGMAVVPLALVSRAGSRRSRAGSRTRRGRSRVVRGSRPLRAGADVSRRRRRSWIVALLLLRRGRGRCGCRLRCRASLCRSTPIVARSAMRRGCAPPRCGSSSIRGRCWPLAATAGCTSPFSTSARATPPSSCFRAAPRCWWMPAGCRRLRHSTSATASSRRCVRDAGVPAARLSSRSRTAIPITSAAPASIVREFRPREVWEGIPVPRFAPLDRAARRGAGGWGCDGRTSIAAIASTVDGVEVVARHPAPADWERQKVRNDDSLVLELRWRDVSVLLTGDIGKAVERDVAAATPPARLRVIKIPHHGSLTSSTPAFLAALRPRIAVVSAGRANHFGHPVPEVLRPLPCRRRGDIQDRSGRRSDGGHGRDVDRRAAHSLAGGSLFLKRTAEPSHETHEHPAVSPSRNPRCQRRPKRGGRYASSCEVRCQTKSSG